MIRVSNCRTRERRADFWKSRQITVQGCGTRERATTKAECHEIWKGYARQPVIMSKFPCLAAVPSENIAVSTVSCQAMAHRLPQVCWQTCSWPHAVNHGSVPLSSHSAYLLGRTQEEIR